jgi:hypothetical protein
VSQTAIVRLAVESTAGWSLRNGKPQAVSFSIVSITPMTTLDAVNRLDRILSLRYSPATLAPEQEVVTGVTY